LGYHSHNNLQLAYSNAINFVQNKNTDRDIIIDSSILGMGRGAGNLTTELIADYMNKKEIKQYNIIPLLDTIDKYLETIYRESYWGYSIAHFLSASFGCHPNYSSFLINKKNLSIIDIKKILSLLDDLEKKNFNKERIEELYINFKSNTSLPTNFNADFFKNKKILILASGSNLIKQKRSVMRFIDDHKPLVVAVNHIPKNIKIDLCFFSNQKRYDKFIEHINPNKIINRTNIKVTTNISNYKVVDYYS
jgi:Isopropylmalate/homocitrate/citramalate synthases